MGELTLASLDRDVARTAASLARWRTEVARDPEAALPDPIEPLRHVAGQTAFEWLGKPVSEHEELHRAALRRWVHELVQARIGLPLERDEIAARVERSAHLHLEPARKVSYREAMFGLVDARAPQARAAWLEALAERGPSIASHAKERAARRREVAARLGLPDARALGPAPGPVEDAARTLLARTHDVYRDATRAAASRAESAADRLEPALARDAGEGWPARLSAHWLDEVLRVLEARKLDLGPLPAPIGAASFARALGAFGRALRRAWASPSLPFALRVEPSRADEHRWGWVFAALPASVAFQRRVLGVSSRVASAQARALAVAALVGVRLEAMRVLCISDDAWGDRAWFEEISASALGAPLPKALAGAWPAYASDRVGRFAGLLAAHRDADELVQRFDEDWFQNPAAARHLRARMSAPCEVELPVEGAAEATARALEHALA